MKLIYIASPYRNNIEENTSYAKECVLNAILQNTVPIAPHLIYPQILDDSDEDERNLGINLALDLLLRCDELWVYGDKITSGMQTEIDVATDFAIPIKYIKELTL